MAEASITDQKKTPESSKATICKRGMVVPANTIVLNLDEIIYYTEMKDELNSTKQSPYLVYLSTEFRSAIKKRKSKRFMKVIFIVIFLLIVLLLGLWILSRIFGFFK